MPAPQARLVVSAADKGERMKKSEPRSTNTGSL